MKHWRLIVEIANVVALMFACWQWRVSVQTEVKTQAFNEQLTRLNQEQRKSLEHLEKVTSDFQRNFAEFSKKSQEEERRVEPQLAKALGNVERKCQKEALFKEIETRISTLVKDQKLVEAERELLAFGHIYGDIPSYHKALAAVYRAGNYDLLAEKHEKQMSLIKDSGFSPQNCK